jgi:hypothetical protein
MITQGLLSSGKIYSFIYLNAKRDTQPIVFVFYKNAKYCEGLNLNYLSQYDQKRIAGLIAKMHLRFGSSGYSGMLLYKVLLYSVPDLVRRCYRKYFTMHIKNCVLISNAVSESDEASYGESVRSISSPFINYLNKLLTPEILDKIKQKM